MWRTSDGARWAVREAAPAERARYDAFVRAHGRGNPLQLWSWGEVKRGDGWLPRRFVLLRDGAIAASVSVVERALPLPGRPRFWLAHRGPVCEPAGPAAERLWAGVATAARRCRALALRCDPEWPLPEARLLRAAGLRSLPPRADWPSGALEPIRVWRISLAGGEAAVFSRFDAHTRSDVRRSQKKGARVRAAVAADLAAFHALELATARRKGFVLRDLGFFRRMWQAWNEGDGGGRLFLAEHEGQIIAGAWFVTCGAGCWGQFAAADPAFRQVLPSAAVYWAGIRWAIARGCAFCDFGGVDWRDDRPDGVRAFKKGFGPGDLRFVGEHDLIVRPAAYRAFRLAEEARWAWISARSRRRRPSAAAG